MQSCVFVYVCVCMLHIFVLPACMCLCVCVCVRDNECGPMCEQPKHFDIPISVSSGTKSVGGSDQTHAGSLQALTLLFSICLSPLQSSRLLFSAVQYLFFYPHPVLPHVCLLVHLSRSSSSSIVVSLSLLSITLCFHHILFMWMVDAHEFMDFCMGPLFRGGPQMISQPAVWNMGLWRNRGGSSKHQTTVLFRSILLQREGST